MSRYDDDLKLKLAWQSAYEQRTCPPHEILIAEEISDELRQHLSFCEACREIRSMSQDETEAWEDLFENMSSSVVSATGDSSMQEGQVWSLSKSLGQWQKDGRYFSPPLVLLLSQEEASSWRVAQLFGDKRLMGDGDVELDERFGFAEGWNSYSLNDNNLNKLLGMISPIQLEEVLSASNANRLPENDESILSFFRSLEKEVGSVFGLEGINAKKTVTQNVKKLIPGMELLASGAKEYVLDVAAETLGVLRGSFRPALVVRGEPTRQSSSKLTAEQKNVIEVECCAVPLDAKFFPSKVFVTLRWLSDKPVEQYNFQIVVDDTALKDIHVSCSHTRVLSVTSLDPHASHLCNRKISNIKILVSDTSISIALVLIEEGS